MAFQDPLVVISRDREQSHALRNLLAGRPSFLVCGGPSAKNLNLNWLNRRGLWSMSVNNMAGSFRPNAFVCSDPPMKFHQGIWLDPSMMKFIPIPKLGKTKGRLRAKINRDFVDLTYNGEPAHTSNCPNIWAFERRAWWKYDDTFFNDPAASWGNLKQGVEMTGNEKTVMTMLLAIRIMYYLGSRRIYLVGVDFHMEEGAGYSFDQKRDSDAIRSNNDQFRVINHGLCKMVENGVFKKFGLEIFNCYRNSGLRAFPYVPFEEAVVQSQDGFPLEPFDLRNWYEKIGSDTDV